MAGEVNSQNFKLPTIYQPNLVFGRYFICGPLRGKLNQRNYSLTNNLWARSFNSINPCSRESGGNCSKTLNLRSIFSRP
jgi:hypothetical protein